MQIKKTLDYNMYIKYTYNNVGIYIHVFMKENYTHKHNHNTKSHYQRYLHMYIEK